MKKNKKYGEINSMQQLVMERKRLQWQVELAEDNLAREYYEVKSYFSWQNLLNMALDRFNLNTPLVSGITSGITAISSLFGGKRKKRRAAYDYED